MELDDGSACNSLVSLCSLVSLIGSIATGQSTLDVRSQQSRK